MKFFLHNVIAAGAFAAAVAMTPACTMIQDDVTDCPTGLYVRFVYDYNTARADMFKDHVGHIRLYVFDENGNKVAERMVSNDDDNEISPLRDYGYAVHFTPAELRPGKYRLQAVALQKDWDRALALPGAKYRPTEVTHSTALEVHLDHAATPHPVTGHHHVEHADLPLDTLWHTLKVMSYQPRDGRSVPTIHRSQAPFSIYPIEEQLVTVEENRVTYATVSMIRDTKHLNVTLRQVDDQANVFADDYTVTVTDANASLAHDNEWMECVPLLYSPYSTWTSRFSNGGVVIEPGGRKNATRADGDDEEVQRTAHYNMMFNRLKYDSDDHTNSAKLTVCNKATGDTIAHINLPYILAQGRIAYDQYHYSSQEYLDREYDYRLDFLLKGDKWLYCDIVINVLSWSRRVQNVEL